MSEPPDLDPLSLPLYDKPMPLSSLPKSFELMEAVIADGGESSVVTLARALDLPVATALATSQRLQR